ncbi:MAG TPA: HAMP domain-containing sensor histidine kinase [Vicinamibacterales bacterium]|nr:HAMP domain-containing sensor histidine kinase [Vicinamibacterales bacterium]
MSRLTWYRSLYWRIAFGFIALLAVLLLVQAALFLVLTGRVLRSARSAVELANEVADAVSFELVRNPGLELEPWLRERFSGEFQPFLVMLNDGRAGSNRPNALPPNFARAARQRGRGRGDFPPGGTGPGRGSGRPSDRDDFGRSGSLRGDRLAVLAPIVVEGRQVGVAAVPANPPPFTVALREVGPLLAWIAVGLLTVGAAVMALVIFRPARQRLHALEEAAAALGAGRTDVRAVETGGDEVSSLARTFNRMADDLGARALALAASDQARRQLLADVSHELMTPLAAIRGYTETLAMPELTLDDETRLRYLAIVGEETQKLETLIGDLLDLARVEGGGGAWAVEVVRLEDLFGRVRDRHGPTLRERRIEMTAAVEPPDLTVRGDSHRLEQALQNLAANALRHTPDGGRVELRAVRDGGWTAITVRDTGPGIPPEHLSRVFDRFYKVDASRAATETPSGSGLGLSIVRAIIERHGGVIAATNAPDRGALFEIRLPVSA